MGRNSFVRVFRRSYFKTIIFFSATLTLSSTALASQHHAFSCGSYILNGKLKKNSADQFVIEVYEGQARAFQVVILGGDLEKKSNSLGQEVGAVVYFPTDCLSKQDPYAYLQMLVAPANDQPHPILIRSESCGNKAKFVSLQH